MQIKSYSGRYANEANMNGIIAQSHRGHGGRDLQGREPGVIALVIERLFNQLLAAITKQIGSQWTRHQSRLADPRYPHCRQTTSIHLEIGRSSNSDLDRATQFSNFLS